METSTSAVPVWSQVLIVILRLIFTCLFAILLILPDPKPKHERVVVDELDTQLEYVFYKKKEITFVDQLNHKEHFKIVPQGDQFCFYGDDGINRGCDTFQKWKQNFSSDPYASVFK